METTQVKTDEAVLDTISTAKQDKPEAQSEQKPSKPIKTISESELRSIILDSFEEEFNKELNAVETPSKRHEVFVKYDEIVDKKIKALQDSASISEDWYVELNNKTYRCSEPEKMVKVIVGNDVHYVEPSAVTKRITYAAVYETEDTIFQSYLTGEDVKASSKKTSEEVMRERGFRVGGQVYIEHNGSKRYGRVVSKSEIYDNLTQKTYPISHFVALGLGRYDNKDLREKTAGWSRKELKPVK